VNWQLLTIPSSVTNLQAYLATHGQGAERIIFEPGSTLRELESYTFAQCESLRHVYIPASVEVIHDFCFQGVDGRVSLQAITFEEGSKLREIKESAFHGCPSLKMILLPRPIAGFPFDSLPPHCVSIAGPELDNRFLNLTDDGLVTDTRTRSVLGYLAPRPERPIPAEFDVSHLYATSEFPLNLIFFTFFRPGQTSKFPTTLRRLAVFRSCLSSQFVL
jgi:hypothetical protein